MVMLYAVSVLAWRMIKQGREHVRETSHVATWLMVDDELDVEEEAMVEAMEIFPAEEGWQDHSCNPYLVDYADICNLLEYNAHEIRPRRNVVTGSLQQASFQSRPLRQAQLPSPGSRYSES